MAKQGPLGIECVPVWKKTVPGHNRLPHLRGHRVAKEPRLPSLRGQVRVTAVEGVPNAQLMPPQEQFRLWIVEEARNVGTHEGVAAESKGQQHWNRVLQVVPACHVVPGPGRSMSVGACKEGPRQDERPLGGAPAELAFNAGAMHIHAKEVVHVSMFHLLRALGCASMQVVSGHAHLGAVENAWLIHVVPCVQVIATVRVDVRVEELRPDVPSSRIAEVRVVRSAWPTKALVVAGVRRLGERALLFEELKDAVPLLFLDVRIHYCHQLSAGLS
mmetsp:Transcript_25857/g.60413  ORF Transcript_25857/g.60413 Transcript_25857/m.60413 type:complete len:273 (+) Transcript_25857:37-855(+)